MIQPTYISESKCGNRQYPMDDAPVPLLRTNYLSEFRTEMEKARARKNLGIPDEMQMKWGGMSGYVEEQRDLIEYMELKWKYTTELSEDITTVAQALDYIMELITTYTDQNGVLDTVKGDIENLSKQIIDTNTLLEETEAALQKNIDTNSEDIKNINDQIESINSAIEQLNKDLVNLDIAPKVLLWMQSHTSSTIKIGENDVVEVIISESEGNAIKDNNGLFVKDNSQEIADNLKAIEELQNSQEDINKTVEEQQKIVDNVKATVDGLSLQAAGYNTMLADEISAPTTVGGITAGTTVGDLKGKLLVDIIDIMLFPTTVRELVYPKLSYTPSYSLIEVGSAFSKPLLSFVQNDAGSETSRTETLTLNGSVVEMADYNQLGTYKYTARVDYEAGEFLTDSKGQVTDKRIEAGYLTATSTYITTYPWYAGSTTSVTKQVLVQFNSSSGEKTITMGGNAVVKLPGTGSKINSFTVDGGLGYTAVNLGGWTESTEELNGITYKVWTKNDPYQSDLSHKINFTLAL